jgi:hypothetical protein
MLLNWEAAYCEKKLSQCYFVHRDPHVDCPEIEPRPPLASLTSRLLEMRA